MGWKEKEQTQQPHRPLSGETRNELITVRLLSVYVPPLFWRDANGRLSRHWPHVCEQRMWYLPDTIQTVPVRNSAWYSMTIVSPHLFIWGGKDTNYFLTINTYIYWFSLIHSWGYHLDKQNKEYHSYRINSCIGYTWNIAIHHRIGSGQSRSTCHTSRDGSQQVKQADFEYQSSYKYGYQHRHHCNRVQKVWDYRPTL